MGSTGEESDSSATPDARSAVESADTPSTGERNAETPDAKTPRKASHNPRTTTTRLLDLASDDVPSPTPLTRRTALLGLAGVGLGSLGVGSGTALGRETRTEAGSANAVSVSLGSTHAIGRGARPRHPGAVVIGDSTAAEIASRGRDEVRSQMPIYAPTFNTTSARAAKTDIEPVDPEAILAGVESLPIHTWRFNAVEDGRHIGPMAEDFHEAFELAQSGETIASVDADGVALAAIQGVLDRYGDEHERLEAALAERRDRVAELESRLDRLEAEVQSDDS